MAIDNFNLFRICLSSLLDEMMRTLLKCQNLKTHANKGVLLKTKNTTPILISKQEKYICDINMLLKSVTAGFPVEAYLGSRMCVDGPLRTVTTRAIELKPQSLTVKQLLQVFLRFCLCEVQVYCCYGICELFSRPVLD